MAALFLHPPIRYRHVGELRNLGLITATQLGIRSPATTEHPFGQKPRSVTARAATGLVGDTSGRGKDKEVVFGGAHEIKDELYKALQGINRGIFGVPSAKKAEIERLVELLEARNPTPQPTENLSDKVDGCWKLIYSTIAILGAKRTKLGLRDFITLGDFWQTIDVAQEKAINMIKFGARGFKMITGQLTIEASFKIASKTRVDIKFENSSIAPEQLMKLFQKNYDLLLSIFNPEGWLEISYVDDSMRIGRDDKGNIFVLERTEQEKI